MRILLVRHGQSEANVDKRALKERPDHDIGLSEDGKEQSRECGEAIANWFRDLPISPVHAPYSIPRIRVWNSPYERAVQTADAIYDRLQKQYNDPRIDRREHILLCEQQFGLFDGLYDGKETTSGENEIAAKYPDEWAHYQKHEEFEGKFWARMPLGESVFDVAQRVHQSFGTFHRDAERHGIDNLVIVCHGVVIRAFLMMWCHYPLSWFVTEPNPRNCSIRLIEDGDDKGYVFPGFDKPKR
jgi:broad specificity phosphatase PhoE